MHNFDLLPSDARTFLSELQTNNSRDWFLANKARYDDSLKAPALALLAALSDRLSALSGAEISTKLFRAHRDVRFSKDKTPYHCHLHMLWREADRPSGPCWFFGVAPDYVTAGWGFMGFTPAQLGAWRTLVDHEASLPGQILATGMRLRDPALKRVPAPFSKDHARGDLLRHKSFTLWGEVEGTPLDEALMARFDACRALHLDLRTRISGD